MTTASSLTERRQEAYVSGLVSVVLPVHNGQGFVGRAIRSALTQTYRHFELLVVDDGSDDNTCVAVSSFDDPRLTLLRLETNRGVSTARNHAIHVASGEFVAFLDSDDEWLADKLERQVGFLAEHPDVAMLHSRVIDAFPTGERMERSLHRRASEYRENLCHDRVVTSTVIVRHTCLDRIGLFDESLRASGDWDLWIRIMSRHRAAHIDEALSIAWLREGSIQRGSVEGFEHFLRVSFLERRREELEAHGLMRRGQAAFDYAVGAKLAWGGRRREARARAWTSLCTRPSAEAAALLLVTMVPSQAQVALRMNLRRLRKVLSQCRTGRQKDRPLSRPG